MADGLDKLMDMVFGVPGQSQAQQPIQQQPMDPKQQALMLSLKKKVQGDILPQQAEAIKPPMSPEEMSVGWNFSPEEKAKYINHILSYGNRVPYGHKDAISFSLPSLRK